MTAFPIAALRSVELDAPDLALAERFYGGAWGLTVAARAPGAIWFRGTGADRHLLALREGPAAFRSATFRAAEESALRRLASDAPVTPLDEPGGGMAATLTAPGGAAIRLVHGDDRRAADPPVFDRPERLAHVNLNCTDLAADRAFFEGTLGFALSDRTKAMAFVRTNADHSAVVLSDAPVDGLNHVAFLLPGWEGVLRAAGRLADAGTPIGWGPGRHGPGDNVFAYYVDPFGIVVEHAAEVLQVDESYRVGGPEDWSWPPGRTDHWGIAPPKPKATSDAQLAIRFAA